MDLAAEEICKVEESKFRTWALLDQRKDKPELHRITESSKATLIQKNLLGYMGARLCLNKRHAILGAKKVLFTGLLAVISYLKAEQALWIF